MFEQLILLGEFIINGLSKIKLSKSKRQSIAKLFGILYRDLDILVENGSNILRLFARHNNGKDVDIDELKSLLEEQHIIIPRITSTINRKDLKTVLSIHAPEISPLGVLLYAKGSRVKFFLNRFNTNEQRNADSSNFRLIRPHARFDFPNDAAITKSRKQLRKIKSLTDQLRQFIVDNFEIHEVI